MKTVLILFIIPFSFIFIVSCASIKNDRQGGGINQPIIQQNIKISPEIATSTSPVENPK